MKPHWELAFKSAWELHSLIVKKDVSPVEIIKDVLKRLEELNPTLNAFLTVTPEIAIEEAKKAEKAVMSNQQLGMLHGLPISIKDHISTAGIRTDGALPNVCNSRRSSLLISVPVTTTSSSQGGVKDFPSSPGASLFPT